MRYANRQHRFVAVKLQPTENALPSTNLLHPWYIYALILCNDRFWDTRKPSPCCQPSAWRERKNSTARQTRCAASSISATVFRREKLKRSAARRVCRRLSHAEQHMAWLHAPGSTG